MARFYRRESKKPTNLVGFLLIGFLLIGFLLIGFLL